MGDLFSKLGINWQSLVFQIINFVILLVILKKFVYRPILNALDQRKKKIAESIKQAEEIDRQAKQATEAHEATLREARQKAQRIIDQANLDAEKVRTEKAEATKQEIEHLLVKAKQQIKDEKHQALSEVKREAGALIIRASEKVLRERLNDKQDQELVERSVKELLRDES